MTNLRREEGFTLVEIIYSVVATAVILGVIFTFHIKSYSVIFGGIHQISAKINCHRVINKLVEDVRHTNIVKIFDHYDEDDPGSQVQEGNYMELYFPAGLSRNDVGYYLSENQIIFIDDLNDQQSNHRVIASDIEPSSGSYIFFKNPGDYTVQFKHRDISPSDGSQRVTITTDVLPRNES